MTITTLLNGVTVGVTEAQFTNITQLTLQSGTTGVALQCALTYTGANESSRLRVYFARCADNLSLNLATMEGLKPTASVLEILPRRTTALAIYDFTDIETVRGGYAYLWLDEPTLVNSATLTVKSIEI